MANIKLNTPLTREAARELKAGDSCLISGVIYTARDAAHKRLMERLDAGEELPFDLKGSAIFCVICYLVISLSPWPFLSLVGCALCGVSVGLMWPGSFSTAAAELPRGGTAMFGLLALAGDVGCCGGPTLVGMVSSALDDNLKMGILAAIIFPIVMVVCLSGKKKA